MKWLKSHLSKILIWCQIALIIVDSCHTIHFLHHFSPIKDSPKSQTMKSSSHQTNSRNHLSDHTVSIRLHWIINKPQCNLHIWFTSNSSSSFNSSSSCNNNRSSNSQCNRWMLINLFLSSIESWPRRKIQCHWLNKFVPNKVLKTFKKQYLSTTILQIKKEMW